MYILRKLLNLINIHPSFVKLASSLVSANDLFFCFVDVNKYRFIVFKLETDRILYI